MSATRERSHTRDRDRTARRAARRVELLDAAVRAIRRGGPSVSMDVIAAEAGVTKPIVYRHFGDRVGLASALAEQFGAALVAELDEALTRNLPPDDLLRATIDAYLAFVERDPHLYNFLVGRLGTEVGNELTNGLITQVGSRWRSCSASSCGRSASTPARPKCGPSASWAWCILPATGGSSVRR